MRPYAITRNAVETALLRCDLSRFSGEQLAEINRDLPSVMSAILNKSHGFDELQLNSLQDVFQFCIDKLVSDRSFSEVTIAIGMGGSEVSPSIRLPAYFSSAISSLQSFHSLKKAGTISQMPAVRIFKANHFSSHMNGFEPSIVLDISEKTFQFLSDFVEHFFPQLAEYIHFESDTNWIHNAKMMGHLETVANVIRATESIRTQIESLIRMGTKHGGERGAQNAFLYAAAHPFYNQSFNLPTAENGNHFFESFAVKTPPGMIIDHGGKPQATFNTIVNAVRGDKRLAAYRQPVLIEALTPTGKVPVYYKARDYDFAIDENPENFDMTKIDRLTKNDFRAIESMVGIENYLKFLRKRHSLSSRENDRSDNPT